MLTEKMKEDLVEQSILFKTPNLSEFQKKVNPAAAELSVSHYLFVRVTGECCWNVHEKGF